MKIEKLINLNRLPTMKMPILLILTLSLNSLYSQTEETENKNPDTFQSPTTTTENKIKEEKKNNNKGGI